MRLIMTLWQGLCHLPTSWHPVMGRLFGNFLLIIPKDRKKIAQANISLCLPNLSADDQKKILYNNFTLLGKSIIETGIAWFWSDAKIKKLVDYEIFGLDLLSIKHSSKGNLIIFKHSQQLELDARILAINAEIYGVSRAHNSALMNKIQNKGRLSSIKDTADKNNPRQFMKWLKDGKNVLYAVDQDYGWDHSVKLKFFDQEAATITTPRKIIDITGSNIIFMNSYYEKNKIVLKLEALNSFGIDDRGLAQKINDLMEEKILLHPAEYLWVHRRFKSTFGKSFYI